MDLFLPPPPPPARRSRRPFITSFLGDVFPFLAARDLLACMVVSRLWREEAGALSLWRALLAHDPAISAYAYQRLSLREMQRVIFSRRPSYPTCPRCPASIFMQPRGQLRPHRKTLETKALNSSSSSCEAPGSASRILFPGMALAEIVRGGNSASNVDGRSFISDVNIFAKSLLESMQNLQTNALTLKEESITLVCVLRTLQEHMSSTGSFWLHQECMKQWKAQKLFEEIVVHSFLSHMGGAGWGGCLRSFVHVEMATLGIIGSPLHLQWCRLKRALPLDNYYYDYLDFLHFFGPGKRQLHTASSLQTDEAIRKFQEFATIRGIVKDVIWLKNGGVKPIEWESFVNFLEMKRRV